MLQAPPIVGSQEERNKRSKNIILSKKSLIEFCSDESSNLLSVQKYELALPAAIQALKFCKEVYGENSVEIIEPYIHLAQSSLGLKHLKKAEEYLSLARWIVLNKPECPESTKAKVSMLKGRVCTAEGKFDEAKADFAEAIYFSSNCNGPESIFSSFGYFRLGDVFLALGNVESSLAFFDKVVDIWYKYLSDMYQESESYDGFQNLMPNQTNFMEKNKSQEKEKISEENIAEGRSQLEMIFEHRKRLLGNSHIATGEIQYTLGLYEYFILNNDTMAENFILSALQAYEIQLGPAHPSTKHVSKTLNIIQRSLSEKLNSYNNPSM